MSAKLLRSSAADLFAGTVGLLLVAGFLLLLGGALATRSESEAPWLATSAEAAFAVAC